MARAVTLLDPDDLRGPVWVVSPHPDDEALGCGALIAARSADWGDVWALLLTDGGASHPASPAFSRARLAAAREAEWHAGLTHLGVPGAQRVCLGLPDGGLGTCDPQDVAQRVRRAFADAPPGTVLLPWRSDPHPDHRAAWQPVLAATPPRARVLGYAVWLAERAAPGEWPAAHEAVAWHCPTAAWSQRKAHAIAAHATQLGGVIDLPPGFTLAPGMVARAVAGPERYFEPLSTPWRHDP